jgi:hypothetical protein
MPRRRLEFRPWADRLEPRMLLTGRAAQVANRNPPRVNVQSSSEPLSSLEIRLQRIENFPAFLASISPGRALPADAVRSIQEDLLLLIGRLGSAPRNGLQAFNQALRSAINSSSISQAKILELENLFGRNLTAAGANPQLVADMAQSLRQIAMADANVPNAGAVVANDYALVLQLALAMGKPLPGPTVPRLTRASNTGRPNDNVTSIPQPTFRGTYAAPGSVMQLINRDGTAAFGTGLIAEDGSYLITVDRPLGIGRHQFRVRAITPDGVISLPSRPFAIRIVAPGGKGPQAR